MRKNYCILCLLRSLLPFCWIVGLLPASSLSAQPSQSISPLPTASISVKFIGVPFSKILSVLSKQFKLNILTDGTPVLNQAEIEMTGSPKEVLDRIADVFDFRWSLSKHGVILFTKRFKNPDEHPQMHLQEMQHMVQDILSFWPRRPGDIKGSIYPLNALYRTFSPEQLQRLQNGQALSLDQLDEQQRSLVQLALQNNLMRNSRDVWEKTSAELGGMPKKGYFQWRFWREARRLKPESIPMPEETNAIGFDYVWGAPTDMDFLRLTTLPEIAQKEKQNVNP